jgi:hypothetical protein
VRDKQNNRKVVYFLPGNTGTARSLGLTEDGAAALEARRDVLDAIATTDVPEDFEGDPVTLLPKKLRAELTGFVEVRAGSQPEAVYSVTLGAGTLPGVMVAAGGSGGYSDVSGYDGGAGGAGGVLGQGARIPVILPVQGTATYTVTVGSTTYRHEGGRGTRRGQDTTIAVQGQTPFSSAIGGGTGGTWWDTRGRGAGDGGSGGGNQGISEGSLYVDGPGDGIPGQGHEGSFVQGSNAGGGGGGYGSPGDGWNGGAGFDLATALNLDPNDGITAQFLTQVTVDGFIAGGGGGKTGTPGPGGGTYPKGHGKDFAGSGGGGSNNGSGANGVGGSGGAGGVYIISDPT